MLDNSKSFWIKSPLLSIAPMINVLLNALKLVYYNTLFQTSFPILVIRHSFYKKKTLIAKKKHQLQITFWKSYLISYFLSISLSVSRNNLNWILILFFNLRIYQDCNCILILLVLEASVWEFRVFLNFFFLYLLRTERLSNFPQIIPLD